MHKIFFQSFLLCCFLFLTGCQKDFQDSPHFLWEIEINGTSHYITGTAHAVQEDLIFNPLLTETFENAKTILFEVDMDSLRLQNQLLFNENGFYDWMLEEEISPETYHKIEKRIQELDWDLGHMPRMKPWLLLQSIDHLEIEKTGLSKDYVEWELHKMAKAEGKKIKGLASWESSYYINAYFSDDLQIQILEERLDHSEKYLENLKHCAQAYEEGQMEAMKACVQNRLDIYPKEVYQKLIIDHNKDLADQIIEAVSKDSTALIVLKLEALLGKDGILQILHEKGVSIKPL